MPRTKRPSDRNTKPEPATLLERTIRQRCVGSTADDHKSLACVITEQFANAKALGLDLEEVGRIDILDYRLFGNDDRDKLAKYHRATIREFGGRSRVSILVSLSREGDCSAVQLLDAELSVANGVGEDIALAISQTLYCACSYTGGVRADIESKAGAA